MKKLLYQFDTDSLPSVFDNVVGYDGGADHICAYGGVNAKNVGGLVEGLDRPHESRPPAAIIEHGAPGFKTASVNLMPRGRPIPAAYSSPDGPYIPGTGMSFRRR